MKTLKERQERREELKERQRLMLEEQAKKSRFKKRVKKIKSNAMTFIVANIFSASIVGCIYGAWGKEYDLDRKNLENRFTTYNIHAYEGGEKNPQFQKDMEKFVYDRIGERTPKIFGE